MICKRCKEAGRINRLVVDKGYKLEIDHHPQNCGCPCMHRSGKWEKLFSVERPK